MHYRSVNILCVLSVFCYTLPSSRWLFSSYSHTRLLVCFKRYYLGEFWCSKLHLRDFSFSPLNVRITVISSCCHTSLILFVSAEYRSGLLLNSIGMFPLKIEHSRNKRHLSIRYVILFLPSCCTGLHFPQCGCNSVPVHLPAFSSADGCCLSRCQWGVLSLLLLISSSIGKAAVCW